MKQISSIAMLLIFSGPSSAQVSVAAKCPPATRVDDTKDTYGKTIVSDPYRWLEDQSSPETRAWIDAEQKCTTATLSKLPGRDALSKRLTELMRSDTVTLPIEKNGRYFFTKRLSEQDLAKLYMRRGKDAADQVLVDPLPWSADHSANVVLENASPDGKLVFFGRRDGGQDEVTVHVMDVDTHRELPDVLPSANYFSVEPSPDDRTVYYAKATAQGPRAYVHTLGADPAEDKLLYGESLGKDKILGVQLSENGEYLLYLVLYGSGSEQNEVYVQNMKERGPIVPVIKDIKALFYPALGGNTLYLLTNWKAPHWRVFSTKLTNPAQDHWREIIPESDATLQNLVPAGGKLVAQYLRNVTSEIKILDENGKHGVSVNLPALGSSDISGRWASPELLYSISSFNFPYAIFVRDLATSRTSLWFQQNISFDSAKYETHQLWYESKDKTRVPMFLFHKKGLTLDGNNRVLLTGYGGFDDIETPYFSATYALWAERGGILAYPNLRGGGEFGEDWHRAGMYEKKQTVFDDFIAAAEYLIASKYTNPSKLSISGGSNGGLLVGAALTQRPDLFQAAVCFYPLLDMLRYQKFMDGPYWVSEYGSADDLSQFVYLYAYSPYHRVTKGKKYPAVLFVTGDGDTRVAPLHARKMSALLQASTGSDRPILLLYDTKSGHSQGRPVDKLIEENTDIFSFLFWQVSP